MDKKLIDGKKILAALKLIKESFMPQNFVDAKLNDGTTIIRYDGDTLVIGAAVLVITDQGEMAIPDGEYTLEDGTVFTVAGGVVAEVSTASEEKGDEAGTEKPAAATTKPAPTKPAAMTEATAKTIVESVIRESRFVTEEVLNAKIAELNKEKETFATQKTASEKEINDLKKTVTELFKLVEQIAEDPSAKPADKPASVAATTKKKTVKELQLEFRGTLK